MLSKILSENFSAETYILKNGRPGVARGLPVVCRVGGAHRHPAGRPGVNVVIFKIFSPNIGKT
jgi:hypothetical protein